MSEPASIAASAQRPAGVSVPGFVGREAELAAIAAALSDGSGVVLVEGEAGIGKSRLLREVLASPLARMRRVLVAACPPFRQPYTLGPVVDAVRQGCDGLAGVRLSPLAGALRPLFPEWAAHLPPTPEPAEDATAARHRLFRALAELFNALGVQAMIVEDAHWADEATLEFLLFLAIQQPQRVTVAVTFRPEDVPEQSILTRLPARLPSGQAPLRLALGPLNVDETASLISSMLTGEKVSPEFAALLHHRTEGIPLAIEESVRLLCDRADLTPRGGGWSRRHLDQIVVPPTVRDAMLERVGRLDLATQAILRAAAVLAAADDEVTLSWLADIPAHQARGAIAAALESGILQDSSGLIGYRHVLGGRAVYEAIPGPMRRAMHLRAGSVLEGRTPTPVAQLARHFREAGDVGRWSGYVQQAADLALASGDEATAATLLHDLLTQAELPARSVIELAKRTPHVAITGPARAWDVIGVLRGVLDRASLSVADEAQVRCLLGYGLLQVWEAEAGHAELQRAVRHLPAGSFDAARAMTRLGVPRDAAVPAAEHQHWLRRAAMAAESDALRSDERAGLLVERAVALLELGEEAGWSEAAKLPERPATARERLLVAAGHQDFGDKAMMWGRYREATRQLDLATAIAEQHQYARVSHIARVTRAHLRWFTGAWDGLADHATTLAMSEDAHPLFRQEAFLVVALLDAANGMEARAQERLRVVLAEYRRHGALAYLAEPAGALARLYLAQSRVDDALRVIEDPLRIIVDKGVWLWATDLAPARVDALIAAGDLDAAVALVRAFARGLGERNAPAPRASLAWCQAALAADRGEHVPAAAAFERAAQAWQALPRPYDELLARERQALCHLAAGEADSGVKLLTEIQIRLRELGANADAGRIRDRLREHGVIPPRVWRGGRHGYGDALSPREVEVVRLVATGLTNQEVARTLSRSPKTVANQLNSAMRKLNVTSRTALAVRAIQAGIAADDAAVED